MKADAEIRAIVERVKRSTRNGDILDLCDELLARLNRPEPKGSAPKRDRAAYMRGWRVRNKGATK